jgi:hypothetical protein
MQKALKSSEYDELSCFTSSRSSLAARMSSLAFLMASRAAFCKKIRMNSAFQRINRQFTWATSASSKALLTSVARFKTRSALALKR